jgi:hypothetical protein
VSTFTSILPNVSTFTTSIVPNVSTMYIALLQQVYFLM